MATKKEVTEKANNAYLDFAKLCKVFFGSNPIDDVTSLDKDSDFYKTAQDIANEFGIDWGNLSPEDNNELILALLEDYYNKVNVDKNFDYVINITVKEKKASKEPE